MANKRKKNNVRERGRSNKETKKGNEREGIKRAESYARGKTSRGGMPMIVAGPKRIRS